MPPIPQLIPIALNDGTTLEVMMLRIARPIDLRDGNTKELESIFLYWFSGKDITTPRHLVRVLKTNLDVLLHNVNHRWAYVIVSSPVLAGFTPNGKNDVETLEMLKQFVAEVAPKIIK